MHTQAGRELLLTGKFWVGFNDSKNLQSRAASPARRTPNLIVVLVLSEIQSKNRSCGARNPVARIIAKYYTFIIAKILHKCRTQKLLLFNISVR